MSFTHKMICSLNTEEMHCFYDNRRDQIVFATNNFSRLAPIIAILCKNCVIFSEYSFADDDNHPKMYRIRFESLYLNNYLYQILLNYLNPLHKSQIQETKIIASIPKDNLTTTAELDKEDSATVSTKLKEEASTASDESEKKTIDTELDSTLEEDNSFLIAYQSAHHQAYSIPRLKNHDSQANFIDMLSKNFKDNAKSQVDFNHFLYDEVIMGGMLLQLLKIAENNEKSWLSFFSQNIKSTIFYKIVNEKFAGQLPNISITKVKNYLVILNKYLTYVIENKKNNDLSETEIKDTLDAITQFDNQKIKSLLDIKGIEEDPVNFEATVDLN